MAHRHRPFGQLFETFLTHIVLGDSGVPSTDAPRRLFWTLAFLLPPGGFLLLALLPEYEAAFLGARVGLVPVGYVDDLTAWIVMLFATYAMVTTGLVAVFAWESLTFRRSDWMVLGTLPLRRSAIVGAKLLALTALLAACAMPVNLLNGFVFAAVTANHASAGVWFAHFGAFVVATAGASTLSFALVLFLRAGLTILVGPRLASAAAVPLQGIAVFALCSLLVFCPFVLDVPFTTSTFTNWMPSSWFVGVFEVVRGSTRAWDVHFPFSAGALRAAVATPVLLAAAVGVAVIQCHQQMRDSVTTVRAGALESAPLARWLARVFSGRDRQAAALADFSVVTIARSRPLRARLAIATAIGIAIITAATAHQAESLTELLRPTARVLWIPLVIAFWTAMGARHALLTPAASATLWTLRIIPTTTAARVRAARSTIAAFVVPRTLVATFALVPVVGWRDTATYAVLVMALTVLLVQLAARQIDVLSTVDRQTTAEALLKGRWTLYAAGLYVFAYLPARLAVDVGYPSLLRWLLPCLGIAVLAVGLWDRTHRRPDTPPAEEDSGDLAIALHLEHLEPEARTGHM